MRIAAMLLATLALAACRTSAPQEPSATPYPVAGVVGAGADSSSSARVRSPAFSTEVLPSMTSTAVVKGNTPLLQRPTSSSVILKTMAAGDTVQVLGPVDNAEGQWLSVSIGDIQGWVRAAQVKP